jgi:hypothetical protein
MLDLLAYVFEPQLTGGNLAVSSHSIAILVTIGFSAIGVVGDYFLKLASQEDTPLRSAWFVPRIDHLHALWQHPGLMPRASPVL